MKNSLFLRYFILFAILISSLSGFSEEVDLTSPCKTVENHLKYLSKENYQPSLATKSFLSDKYTSKELQQLAISLKQYYNSKGLLFKCDAKSDNPNYFDSNANLQYFYPFKNIPDIYLIKKGDSWYYSQETIDKIPELHKSVFRFGTDKILNLLPKIGSNRILGILVWQLYGLLAIFIISFIAYEIFRFIFGKAVFRIIKHFISVGTSRKFIKPLSKPLSMLAAIIVFLLFLPVIQFTAGTNHKIIIIGKILISVYSMILFYRIVDVIGAYLSKAATKTESTLDDQLAPLITKVLKVVVIIIGILFILQNLDFNITALLAGISIGGLAIALAAQDSIKNFFGSLLIFVDKPFQVGDWIISDKVDGTVEEVGFRSTRVRTFSNSLITIPNGKLADQVIDNMGMRVFRRYKTDLSITYDTPPFKIENFVDGLKAVVMAHPHTRKDYFIIQFSEMSDYSLKILFQIYFIAPDYAMEMKFRHEILMAIVKLADELKIRWAYPSETVFIEEIPGQPSLRPKHNEQAEQQRKKITAFIGNIKKSFSPSTQVSVINQPQKIETVKQIPKQDNLEKPKPEIISEPKTKDVRAHKKGRELADFEIEEAAKLIKADIKTLKALILTEAKNKSFYQDGKPGIVFQGHRFWKELKKRNIEPETLQAKYPDVVYPNYNKKHIRNNEKEYERLEKAKAINKEAAYMATQWGMFKISGHHFKECGFTTVNEMVHNFYKTENEQLKALISFYQSKNITDDIRSQNWEMYGKKAHGKTFNYDKFVKDLDKAFQKIAQDLE